MMGGGQQQLQQLSQELQALDEEIEALEVEIDDHREEQSDIDDAIEAIETLDSGSTVQVPLGGGAYVRAEVQDIDEIIVSLGGNYSAEQSEEDAIDVLGRKRDALDDRIEETQEEVDELESESQELEQQAQQMQQQMQQQQMQQMQQSQGDEE
ncbi:prefoldin, alpha subunit [Halorubrum lacusprofundi ATCC 49239]|jgi:prefoldin alpha subunit|uniref:Prefoldin subunit alpha n=2 Tax=Halorubrum lacusprofundi TaxID=2247 RepID=PFDA_HALLT|nr:RecName: Full=Prefoldin subunit alpha; AltName: Full=GimC subunit alpha [Halorubrum lacusprofundi ATCC 49239]ACM56421.1 prefoldin, alpha subunit [Halorubrum lacusprofundi ATCC 49239]